MTIRVEVVGGRGEDYSPGPGRILLVGPRHSFADLAEGIDAAFARWDLAHLHEFTLADGRRLAEPTPEDELGDEPLDEREFLVTSTVTVGDRFCYVFDLGDCWTHDCVVDADNVDPRSIYGTTPRRVVPVWGWGEIPDQYGRRWDGDDGEHDLPPGHTVDERQVIFRVAGVDVRIYRDRAGGVHLADAQPVAAGPHRLADAAAGRLTQAGDEFAAVQFPAAPRWLRELASDPHPCRPGLLSRHGADVLVSVPQPFRREVLLPWLGQYDR